MLCCWVFHFYYVDRDQKKTYFKFLKNKDIEDQTFHDGFRIQAVSRVSNCNRKQTSARYTHPAPSYELTCAQPSTHKTLSC